MLRRIPNARRAREIGSFSASADALRPFSPRSGWAAAALLLLGFLACEPPARAPYSSTNLPPRSDYAEVAERLSTFIEHEMADKELPALSIALVDDQETVWATGFGFRNPDAEIPATAETVYRVGSVSKLFTDIAVMQLVEEDRLDLDAPITDYLPDFEPENPFGGTITLRQLMSHRSGLVREPPVGHYFDDTEPSLAATVASLNRTSLVYAPESRTKYSNAGIATVGYVLERLLERPFPGILEDRVLARLGMESSSFVPEAEVVDDLATAYMWAYDGREFEAPTFQLGMAPAGSMYAPVTDLARFMSALFAGGTGAEGRVLEAATVDSMLTPQFSPPGATTGYGMGFRLSRLDGHRRVGHGGAIYGFATELAALPDERLGAVAVTSMDVSNTVVTRVADYALRLMLAARAGEPLPEADMTDPLPAAQVEWLRGSYTDGEQRVEVSYLGDEAYAWFRSPGFTARLRGRGDTAVVDDRHSYGVRIVPTDQGIAVDGTPLTRLPEAEPDPAPAAWRALIGEYGWDHNTLFILERNGELHALIEWVFEYPLRPATSRAAAAPPSLSASPQSSGERWAFPDWGLYHGEGITFERNAEGRVTAAIAAGIRFERRAVGTEAGETFTIDPVRPVEELRPEALAASPPEEEGDFREPDLVELRSLDPTIRYDIRYATTNNFMQSVFYDEPHAFMQRPAAEALVRAHQALAEQGYGLLIHDAYRPWFVTRMFWDATPDEQKIFVANPANGSRHNRGAAVDLTLYDLATREPVEMVGGYDEFSERSFPTYPGGTSYQRWHRDLLRRAMEAEGFTVYEWEWWHFDYGDWRSYPILNLRFDEVGG